MMSSYVSRGDIVRYYIGIIAFVASLSGDIYAQPPQRWVRSEADMYRQSRPSIPASSCVLMGAYLGLIMGAYIQEWCITSQSGLRCSMHSQEGNVRSISYVFDREYDRDNVHENPCVRRCAALVVDNMRRVQHAHNRMIFSTPQESDYSGSGITMSSRARGKRHDTWKYIYDQHFHIDAEVRKLQTGNIHEAHHNLRNICLQFMHDGGQLIAYLPDEGCVGSLYTEYGLYRSLLASTYESIDILGHVMSHHAVGQHKNSSTLPHAVEYDCAQMEECGAHMMQRYIPRHHTLIHAIPYGTSAICALAGYGLCCMLSIQMHDRIGAHSDWN